MKKLTVITLKTPAMDGTVYTVQHALDHTPIGVYQYITPEIYPSPVAPLAEAVYVDVRPSDISMKVSPSFALATLDAGFAPELIQPKLLPQLELLVREVDDVKHVPVLTTPLSAVKQYEMSDDVWQVILQKLKAIAVV